MRTFFLLSWLALSVAGTAYHYGPGQDRRLAFVPWPNVPALVGLQAWLQAAVLPFTGQPGLTNAVYEVVVR